MQQFEYQLVLHKLLFHHLNLLILSTKNHHILQLLQDKDLLHQIQDQQLKFQHHLYYVLYDLYFHQLPNQNHYIILI